MIEKITLLGGSSVNTPELFQCLAERQLAVEEVCLIGRSPEKLEAVVAFSRRLCDELGLRARVTPHTDLRAGLEGAEFVINQVKVGGSNVWNRCQHLLRSFGIEGHALNHGGLLSNLHIVLDYARTILEVCPQAWLIEFTNPCGIHAEAFATYTPGLKVITGCNVPLGARRTAAELLGERVDPTQVGGVEIGWFGFNHCAWFQSVTAEGRDVTDEVLQRNAALEKPRWNVPLIERFGVIPVADAARLLDKPTAPPEGEDVRRAEEFAASDAETDAEALALYADAGLRPTKALAQKRRANWYHSCLVCNLEGLASKDTPRRYYCSMPTAEAMPDFPGKTVECAVTVCDGQVTALPPPPMPRSLRPLAARLRASEELIIEAAMRRSRRLAIESLALHPSCPTLRQAERVVDYMNHRVSLGLQ